MILDEFRLDGKAALVTGGSQGLGMGMALALAEAGADVAVLARHEDKLEQAAEQIEERGGRSMILPVDISDLDAALAAVDNVANAFGRLDILVTSAAAQVRKPVLEVTRADWDYMLAVNLRAVYFMCQRAAHHILKRDRPNGDGIRGKIINIASLTALGAWPNVSIYGTTKGGVLQMTKAMALEWAPLGICANAIGPGTFHTDLTDPLYTDPVRSKEIVSRIPLGRPGLPRDLAGAVVYLASPASDYATGQVIWVDGGWLVNG